MERRRRRGEEEEEVEERWRGEEGGGHGIKFLNGLVVEEEMRGESSNERVSQ